MKGHLDAEQLKSMDYKSLQALAKDMGVSAAGKAEDIIARIAAVEVDALFFFGILCHFPVDPLIAE